jgi:hypothetical protein
MIGHHAEADEILIGPHLPDAKRQIEKRAPFAVGEHRAAGEPVDESLQAIFR